MSLWRRFACLSVVALCSFLCTAAVPSPELCPVQLLTIESTCAGSDECSAEAQDGEPVEEMRLNEAGLKYLRNLSSPLYIVPMVGVYRGGKSLVLNRLMGLQAPYEHGFGVGHGQDTYTRGIYMCAEYVDGLGSVVWMDTEGLFSAEDARSAHGPRIFSLALLYASIVMVNSVKVFNEQFFAFFGQQQQIARVLKQGLIAEGLPHSSLLPSNLSIFWILSQPLKHDPTGKATEAQLHKFLATNKGDDLRHHVQRDFSHRHLEIPVATDAATQWGRLDQLPDNELSLDYINAVRLLRAMVLGQLQHARPLQAASIAKQLQIYVEAVQSKRFSVTMVKEAFEDEQIEKICNEYGRELEERVGDLPTFNIQDIGDVVMEELKEAEVAAIAEFHFNEAWSMRVKSCMKGKLGEMSRKNLNAALGKWRAEAVRIAAGDSYLFLAELMQALENCTKAYGEGSESEAEMLKGARDYAEALQKTRLMGCLRPKDLMVPFLPWLAWPVLSLFMKAGPVTGLLFACSNGIFLLGFYGVVVHMGGLLPPYLNIDYPILQDKPFIVDMIMKVLPICPWVAAARLWCSAAGALWSAYRFLRHIRDPALRAGPQLVNLELKINNITVEQQKMYRLVEGVNKLLAKNANKLDELQKHMQKQDERWKNLEKYMQSRSAAAADAPRSANGQSQPVDHCRPGVQTRSVRATAEPSSNVYPKEADQVLRESQKRGPGGASSSPAAGQPRPADHNCPGAQAGSTGGTEPIPNLPFRESQERDPGCGNARPATGGGRGLPRPTNAANALGKPSTDQLKPHTLEKLTSGQQKIHISPEHVNLDRQKPDRSLEDLMNRLKISRD